MSAFWKRSAVPRPVATIGNPVLRATARELRPEEIGSEELDHLLEDLVATMHKEGGIGIAAPQVGVSVRAAVIEIELESERYPESPQFDLEVFLNPTVTVLDQTEQSYWEGCLSIPDLRGLVPRPRRVRVDYTDARGEAKSIEAEGFLATVLQHELDHLDGILFVDRVRDTTKLATIEDYRRYWLEQDPSGPHPAAEPTGGAERE
jgi:peptide deformylase